MTAARYSVYALIAPARCLHLRRARDLAAALGDGGRLGGRRRSSLAQFVGVDIFDAWSPGSDSPRSSALRAPARSGGAAIAIGSSCSRCGRAAALAAGSSGFAGAVDVRDLRRRRGPDRPRTRGCRAARRTPPREHPRCQRLASVGIVGFAARCRRASAAATSPSTPSASRADDPQPGSERRRGDVRAPRCSLTSGSGCGSTGRCSAQGGSRFTRSTSTRPSSTTRTGAIPTSPPRPSPSRERDYGIDNAYPDARRAWRGRPRALPSRSFAISLVLGRRTCAPAPSACAQQALVGVLWLLVVMGTGRAGLGAGSAFAPCRGSRSASSLPRGTPSGA